jgi:hypothetical protein
MRPPQLINQTSHSVTNAEKTSQYATSYRCPNPYMATVVNIDALLCVGPKVQNLSPSMLYCAWDPKFRTCLLPSKVSLLSVTLSAPVNEHASAQQNLDSASIATAVGTDASTLSLLFQHSRKPRVVLEKIKKTVFFFQWLWTGQWSVQPF